MKKKKPTIADLMKKLEELEAEVKALRAAPIQHHYYYSYYSPYQPPVYWQPYPWGTTICAQPNVTSGSYVTYNNDTRPQTTYTSGHLQLT